MPPTTFDIWDQALLTDTILLPRRGNVPGAPTEDLPDALGGRIAPLKPHRGRSAKIRVRDVRPFGKAPLRAPDATPQLFKPPGVTWSETIMELVLIDEMERIMEEEWLKLNNPDENVRRSAGLDLVERGRILELRNLRATEDMRWKAFQGTYTATYDTGASFVIDYGIPASHKPTAGTPWTDLTNADPVANLRAWTKLIADDAGFPARFAHMNSATYDYLIRNQKVLDMINFYSAGANSIKFPRRDDLSAIFATFAGQLDIVIYDNGYRDIGSTTISKYLPDGKILITTDYTIDGTNIADTLDGEVVVSAGYNQVAIRQGWQAEVMLDHLSKNHYLRSASARIPRILVPEAFVYATAY